MKSQRQLSDHLLGKSLLLKIASLALVLSASNGVAIAGPIFEDFNYPVGAGLNGQNGGTGFSNAWVASTDYTIGGGSLVFGNLQGGGNHVAFSENNLAASEASRNVSASGFGADGTTTWMSFVLRPDSNPTSGEFTFGIDGELFIGKPSTLNTITNYEVNGQASSVQIVQGTTAFVVVEFQFNADPNANDTATVFFDPTPGLLTPNAAGLTVSDINFSSAIGAIFLDAGNGMAFSFDPLRTGSTFLDVAPASATSVPEPSSLALLGVGITGLSFIRRRKVKTR